MVICFVHSDSLLVLQPNLKKHASIGLWNLKTHTLRNTCFNKNMDKRKIWIIFSKLQQKEKWKSQDYGSEMLKWCGHWCKKRSKSARNWVMSLKWNLWPWQNFITFSQQTETYIFSCGKLDIELAIAAIRIIGQCSDYKGNYIVYSLHGLKSPFETTAWFFFERRHLVGTHLSTEAASVRKLIFNQFIYKTFKSCKRHLLWSHRLLYYLQKTHQNFKRTCHELQALNTNNSTRSFGQHVEFHFDHNRKQIIWHIALKANFPKPIYKGNYLFML